MSSVFWMLEDCGLQSIPDKRVTSAPVIKACSSVCGAFRGLGLCCVLEVESSEGGPNFANAGPCTCAFRAGVRMRSSRQSKHSLHTRTARKGQDVNRATHAGAVVVRSTQDKYDPQSYSARIRRLPTDIRAQQLSLYRSLAIGYIVSPVMMM